MLYVPPLYARNTPGDLVHILSRLLLPGAVLFLAAAGAQASNAIDINPSSRAPLFDGRCDKAEWKDA